MYVNLPTKFAAVKTESCHDAIIVTILNKLTAAPRFFIDNLYVSLLKHSTILSIQWLELQVHLY